MILRSYGPLGRGSDQLAFSPDHDPFPLLGHEQGDKGSPSGKTLRTKTIYFHPVLEDMESTLSRNIKLKCRIDTAIEIEYIEHGGVLHYVLRNLAQAA